MKIGTTELMIILAVVMIVFGPTQIPKLTRMFGDGIREFREGMGPGKENLGQDTKESMEKESVEKETI